MEIYIDQKYELTHLRLTIANRQCARLDFGLALAAPLIPRSSRIQWSLGAQPGVLRFAGQKLPFLVTGFTAPQQAAGLELHATPVSRGLWNWLAESPTTATPLLLYQRQDPQVDANAWAFVRRLAGYHLAEPEGALDSHLEKVLPAHACFPRRRSWSNLDFLERLLVFLDELVPHVWGWCAFPAPNQAIHLITDPVGQPVVLDHLWQPAGQECKEGRPGWSPSALRWSATRDFHPRDPARMFLALCTRGRPGAAAGFGGLPPHEDAAQVIPRPGLVRSLGREVFCREAVYTFSAESAAVTAELHFGLDRPPVAPLPACKLTGLFDGWAPTGSGPSDRLAVKPRPGGAWAVLADRQTEPDPEKPLWVEALLPTVVRESFAGLYVRYKPGDRLRVRVDPGDVPDLKGSPQHRHERLEQNDVTLNAPTVGLQTAPSGNAPAGADGLRLDGPARQVRAQTAQGKNCLELSGEDSAHFTADVRMDQHLDVQ
jgi:hypothetical protein